MRNINKANKGANTGVCREIARNVYYAEIGRGISRSNVYFIKSGPSWVLIDAASANCSQLIQRIAVTLFGADTRPESILLTHDHPDHAGSALELACLWGCPVYLHPDELPLATAQELSTIEKYASPLDRWIILPLLRAMPRRRVEAMFSRESLKDVARAFDPGGVVPGLPDWKCIPTPGHMPGHTAFFRTSDRVLITGDAVVTVDLNSFWGFLWWCLGRNKQRIAGPPWYSTLNGHAAKESVAVLAVLEPLTLAPGHGVPVTGAGIARELRAFSAKFSGPANVKPPGKTTS